MSLFKIKTEKELEEKKSMLQEAEAEHDLSKKLGDVEKIYREGLTTLKGPNRSGQPEIPEFLF